MLIVAVVVAILVLGRLAAGSSEEGEPAIDDPGAVLHAVLGFGDPEQLRTYLNVAAFYRTDLGVRRCMEDAGFDYVVSDVRARLLAELLATQTMASLRSFEAVASVGDLAQFGRRLANDASAIADTDTEVSFGTYTLAMMFTDRETLAANRAILDGLQPSDAERYLDARTRPLDRSGSDLVDELGPVFGLAAGLYDDAAEALERDEPAMCDAYALISAWSGPFGWRYAFDDMVDTAAQADATRAEASSAGLIGCFDGQALDAIKVRFLAVAAGEPPGSPNEPGRFDALVAQITSITGTGTTYEEVTQTDAYAAVARDESALLDRETGCRAAWLAGVADAVNDVASDQLDRAFFNEIESAFRA